MYVMKDYVKSSMINFLIVFFGQGRETGEKKNLEKMVNQICTVKIQGKILLLVTT